MHKRFLQCFLPLLLSALAIPAYSQVVLPAGLLNGGLAPGVADITAGLGAEELLGGSDILNLDGLDSDLGQDILLLGAPMEGLEGELGDPMQFLIESSEGQTVIEFLQDSDIDGAMLAPEVTTILLPTEDDISCEDVDNDGVCDEKDYCPNTPAEAIVFFWGCHISQYHPLPLVGVSFEERTDRLKAPAIPVLRKLAALLKGGKPIRVEIRYLPRSTGAEASALGEQRLQRVAAFLADEGVDRQRFSLRVLDDEAEAAAAVQRFETDLDVELLNN